MNASDYYGDFYNPDKPSFFFYETMDAIYSGLDFFLLNSYGHDLNAQFYQNVNAALDKISSLGLSFRYGLMDDTWIWGTPWGGKEFEMIPDLYNIEKAASEFYAKKWKPFFMNLKRQYWFTEVSGKPIIYFYNAGKLNPPAQITLIVERMKKLFLMDFGVEPFVVLDVFYPPGNAADAQFKWDTFYLDSKLYTSPISRNGLRLAHFMSKWDAKGRDQPGEGLNPTDRLFKGPELLIKNLQQTINMDVVVLATWNDLGEGTSVNRQYDYWYKENWLHPTFFMDIIRNSQCT